MTNKKLILCALFCAFGVLFPPIFHMFGAAAGATFLPMHIPVLISGFILGPIYGLIVGLISPLLSSLITGMPPIPKLPFMIFELMAYGYFSGLFVKLLPTGKLSSLFLSLIAAQITGRIINALCLAFAVYLLGLKSVSVASAWTSVAVGIPGIIIQLLIIPPLVKYIQKGVHLNG